MNFSNHDNLTTLRCGWPMEPKPASNDIRYLDFATYPVLLGVASIGNILTLVTLTFDHPRTSKNVYILVMALLDLGYMWSQLFTYIKQSGAELSDNFLDFSVNIFGVCCFLQEICAFASDGIIIAFSLDRLFAIQSPLQHKLLINSVKRTVLIIITVIIGACVLASNRLVDYYWFLAVDPGNGHPIPVRPAGLLHWRIFYTWALSLVPIVTFTAILLINTILMRVLLRRRNDRSLVKLQASAEETRVASECGAVVMLTACVVLYLVTQFPAVIWNIIETLDVACIRRYSRLSKAVSTPVKSFVLNVNYSANFVLYCIVNPAFRMAVRKRLRRSIHRDGSPQLSSVNKTSSGNSRTNSLRSLHMTCTLCSSGVLSEKSAMLVKKDSNV